MTTEIAIMNKSAIALAADSAVTVGHVSPQGQEQKIYNSANKLFALSKHAPVGIMIYGNASLMGIPWETIIKTYRGHLGQKKFNFLKNYCEHFFQYLDKFDVGTETEQQYVSRVSSSVFFGIRKQLDKLVKEGTEKGKVSEEDMLNILKTIIQNEYNNFIKIPQNKVFSKTNRNELKKKYFQIITRSFSDAFEKRPVSQDDQKKLWEMAIIAITVGPANQSGIVMAGFGEKEIFPVCHEFDVRAILEGRTIKAKGKDHCITHDSDLTIRTFAQSEEVCTFMEGMGRSIDGFFKNAFNSMMVQAFPSKLSGALADKLKIDDPDIKNSILDIIRKMGQGAVDEINKTLESIKRQYYINPVVKATSYLNKGELAAMAETLVNLVSFRKQVTLEAETVGGPIDVAVISKGDGFVWIKRKHYFDPALNHHFFKNYFSGGIVNEKE